MIQVDHMASAAATRVQVNFVGLVTEKIVKEMQVIEDEMRQRKICNGSVKAFRMAKSSKPLKKFIDDNNIWNCHWDHTISGEHLKRKKEEELSRKVMEYREKIMLSDRIHRKNYYEEWLNRRRFWRPINLICFVCRERSHRTSDCLYTFERVKERMLEEEKKKTEKYKLATEGGYRIIKHEFKKGERNRDE
jgi:hypothetical protein